MMLFEGDLDDVADWDEEQLALSALPQEEQETFEMLPEDDEEEPMSLEMEPMSPDPKATHAARRTEEKEATAGSTSRPREPSVTLPATPAQPEAGARARRPRAAAADATAAIAADADAYRRDSTTAAAAAAARGGGKRRKTQQLVDGGAVTLTQVRVYSLMAMVSGLGRTRGGGDETRE